MTDEITVNEALELADGSALTYPTVLAAEVRRLRAWDEQAAAVPRDQLASLLISATRYALGRATYIVGDTVAAIVQHAPRLDANTRHVLARDISTALDQGRQGDGLRRPSVAAGARRAGRGERARGGRAMTRFRVEAEWIVEGREEAVRLAESLMLMGAETSSSEPLPEIPDGFRPGCSRQACPCRRPGPVCEECMCISPETGPYCPRCGWHHDKHQAGGQDR